MNRSTVRNTATLEKAPVHLYAKISIGASGAPTLNIPQCQGIASITRTGTGAYTIDLGQSATLVDTYQRLIGARVTSLVSGGLPAAPDLAVVEDNSNSLPTPNVEIQLSLDGAAADPANGEVLLLELVFSNTTAV